MCLIPVWELWLFRLEWSLQSEWMTSFVKLSLLGMPLQVRVLLRSWKLFVRIFLVTDNSIQHLSHSRFRELGPSPFHMEWTLRSLSSISSSRHWMQATILVPMELRQSCSACARYGPHVGFAIAIMPPPGSNMYASNRHIALPSQYHGYGSYLGNSIR